MEHTKHIWRAALILVVILIAAIIGRHFMIPKSFGGHGFYRFDSVAEHMAKPVVHGNVDSCQPCHAKECDTVKAGKHATNSCQNCHGPLSSHVKDNAKIADATIDKSPKVCLNCHQKLRARPESFPQIDVMDHLASNGAISKGEAIPDEVCVTCHDTHNPGLK